MEAKHEYVSDPQGSDRRANHHRDTVREDG
jgi:hypothetical protein